MIRTASWAMLALAGTLCVAGCSRKIDTDKLEKHIASELGKTGTKPEKVDCPDDVTEKKGGTFECTAKADDGSKATITVEMQGEGEITWKVTATGGGKKTADDTDHARTAGEPNEPSADEGDEADDEPSEDEL